MNRNRNNSGFSLIEVLIATGILAIGMVMVATIFPVGVKLTTLTTEHTIGAVVADEAFAKIQLYGLRDFGLWPVTDPSIECSDFQYIANLDYNGDTFIDSADVLPPYWFEFQYPSSVTLDQQDRNYHWSALCRRVGAKDVQVTVFVSRKVAAGAGFYGYDSTLTPVTSIPFNDWPTPVKVEVTWLDSKTLELSTTGVWGNKTLNFIDDGYTIVDGYSGNIYRVLEVDRTNNYLILQQDWQITANPNAPNETIWVVPPAVNSDRYPCVGVYQKVIRFDDIN